MRARTVWRIGREAVEQMIRKPLGLFSGGKEVADFKPTVADVAEQLTRVEWKLDRLLFGKNTPEGHYRDSQMGKLRSADGQFVADPEEYNNPLPPTSARQG